MHRTVLAILFASALAVSATTAAAPKLRDGHGINVVDVGRSTIGSSTCASTNALQE
jgi:hypothetical protein